MSLSLQRYAAVGNPDGAVAAARIDVTQQRLALRVSVNDQRVQLFPMSLARIGLEVCGDHAGTRPHVSAGHDKSTGAAHVEILGQSDADPLSIPRGVGGSSSIPGRQRLSIMSLSSSD